MLKGGLLDALLFWIDSEGLCESDICYVQDYSGRYVSSFERFKELIEDFPLDIDNPQVFRCQSICVVCEDCYFIFNGMGLDWEIHDIPSCLKKDAADIKLFLE